MSTRLLLLVMSSVGARGAADWADVEEVATGNVSAGRIRARFAVLEMGLPLAAAVAAARFSRATLAWEIRLSKKASRRKFPPGEPRLRAVTPVPDARTATVSLVFR